jgi:hypothetical protein
MALRKFIGAREIGSALSIEEAVTFFDGLARPADKFMVFRGHADTSWYSVPSLFRTDPDISGDESQLVRELVSRYPHEFTSDVSMFDRLVRMQHFGLPTRMLDVTRNPLVALYFAVVDGEYDGKDGAVVITTGSVEDRRKYFDSDAVSCVANLANLTASERRSIEASAATTIKDFNKLAAVDRLYQFIRSEKPYFRKVIKKIDLFRPYFVIPKMNNRRLIAQSGAFIIHGLDQASGPSYTRTITNTKLTIPATAKGRIRRSLHQLGYDDSTLFPEIDRASRQLVRHFSDLKVALTL